MPAAPTATAAVAATTAGVPAASATATTAALCLRPRFIDHEVSPAEILTVQRINGAIRVLVITHFDEGESTRLARKTIADQIDTRGSYTHLREPFVELVFRGGKRKIPNVELLHLPTPSARNLICHSRSAPK
jgi:hypothetical protein